MSCLLNLLQLSPPIVSVCLPGMFISHLPGLDSADGDSADGDNASCADENTSSVSGV